MGVLNPHLYQIPEFSNFNSFLFDWLRYRDVTTLDFVLQPQFLFLFKNGSLIVDYICCLENLSHEISFVEKTLGRKLSLKDLNRTSTSSTTSLDNFTRPQLELISSIYSSDYRLLGYDPYSL